MSDAISESNEFLQRRSKLKDFVKTAKSDGDLLELLEILVFELSQSDSEKENRIANILIDAGFLNDWKAIALEFWNSCDRDPKPTWQEVFEHMMSDVLYPEYLARGKVPANAKAMQAEILRYSKAGELPIRSGKRGRKVGD
ncbi:MAG: hypothetical protein ACON4H_09205 [Rubripirellula sp.]